MVVFCNVPKQCDCILAYELSQVHALAVGLEESRLHHAPEEVTRVFEAGIFCCPFHDLGDGTNDLFHNSRERALGNVLLQQGRDERLCVRFMKRFVGRLSRLWNSILSSAKQVALKKNP